MKIFLMTKDVYSLISIYFIPTFTVLLASELPWIESNLSVIGNYYDRKLGLTLWGIIVAFYIFFYMNKLFDNIGYKNKITENLVLANSIITMLAVAIPYLPHKFPVKSVIHEMLAFMIPILFLVIMIRFLGFLNKLDKSFFYALWRYLIGIVVVGFLVLISLGFVTSLLEIIVTISICYFIRYLDIKIFVYNNS